MMHSKRRSLDLEVVSGCWRVERIGWERAMKSVQHSSREIGSEEEEVEEEEEGDEDEEEVEDEDEDEPFISFFISSNQHSK